MPLSVFFKWQLLYLLKCLKFALSLLFPYIPRITLLPACAPLACMLDMYILLRNIYGYMRDSCSDIPVSRMHYVRAFLYSHFHKMDILPSLLLSPLYFSRSFSLFIFLSVFLPNSLPFYVKKFIIPFPVTIAFERILIIRDTTDLPSWNQYTKIV